MFNEIPIIYIKLNNLNSLTLSDWYQLESSSICEWYYLHNGSIYLLDPANDMNVSFHSLISLIEQFSIQHKD